MFGRGLKKGQRRSYGVGLLVRWRWRMVTLRKKKRAKKLMGLVLCVWRIKTPQGKALWGGIVGALRLAWGKQKNDKKTRMVGSGGRGWWYSVDAKETRSEWMDFGWGIEMTDKELHEGRGRDSLKVKTIEKRIHGWSGRRTVRACSLGKAWIKCSYAVCLCAGGIKISLFADDGVLRGWRIENPATGLLCDLDSC